MIFTRNGLSVSSQVYGPTLDWYLGREGAEALTINVSTAGVYMQVGEEDHPGLYPSAAGSELELAVGFHSKPLAKRAHNLRLRAAGPTAATVSVSAYG